MQENKINEETVEETVDNTDEKAVKAEKVKRKK